METILEYIAGGEALVLIGAIIALFTKVLPFIKGIDRVSRRNEILNLLAKFQLNKTEANKVEIQTKFYEYKSRGYNGYIEQLLINKGVIEDGTTK